MPRFCANLGFLFTEAAFPDRFERAARAGFQGVEYMSPYDYPAAELARLLRENGLQQVLFNLPAGDWAAGERGLAALPGREAEFRAGVELAIDYARQLGCTQVNALAGIPLAGSDRNEVRTTLIANLRDAAPRLAAAGIRLLVEPINSRIDMPGFWLDTPKKALSLIESVGEPNLWLQYDVYHAQVMEGDLARTIAANIDRIAHVQIADNPGRNEPGTGEVNYPYLFALLDRIGYAGWVGCEYRPLAGSEAGLGWLKGVAAAPPAAAREAALATG
ncbi:MAG: hydroxypyruvate isomerase [Rhodocyclales bacterium]|nr:hydroxypyruvate isomerase [Rhodocyclales bacterium]